VPKNVLRQRELEICQFYDWNISFVTFYDILREYLSLGLIDEQDEVLTSNRESAEKSPSPKSYKSLNGSQDEEE
jgi:hypothetical protein